jgi:hypothetical protein
MTYEYTDDDRVPYNQREIERIAMLTTSVLYKAGPQRLPLAFPSPSLSRSSGSCQSMLELG